MKHRMQSLGVNPLVIPNGLSADDLVLPERQDVAGFRSCLRGRTVLSKVARWDPAKGWLLALDTVSAMKRLGWQPLLIARGGTEAYGDEVLAAAAGADLRVVARTLPQPGVRGLLHALERLEGVDVVHLRSPLDLGNRRVLFRGSDAGWSGEDYAVPGHNALVLETTDPWELIGLLRELHLHPAQERAIRRAGRMTARHYLWPQILSGILLSRLRLLAPLSADEAPWNMRGELGRLATYHMCLHKR